MMYTKKLFIVVNTDVFLLSHRKEVAIAALQEGFDVTIVAYNTGKKDEIESCGLKFIDLPNVNSIKNIFYEIKIFLFIFRLYKKQKPNIVHHVGLKLILYGTITARIVGIKGVVNAVSGLGTLFSLLSCNMNWIIRIIKRTTIYFLKLAHKKKSIMVIFQNDEDKNIFVNMGIVKETQTCKIKGSGIDLRYFQYTVEPNDNIIRVLFTARMLREKGVIELVEAARMLREEYYHKVQFLLCGDIYNNPQSLTKSELENFNDSEYIKWLGHRTDVKELLEQSHIFAFPSYYREGLPKSIIEACAIGRPIITTDSVGCRDCIIDGYNGFLVPAKDIKALVDKLKIMIDDRSLRIKMGGNSRKFAEKYFSINDVVGKHLQIYERLINKDYQK